MRKLLTQIIIGLIITISVILLIVEIQHKPRLESESDIENISQIHMENLYVTPLPSSRKPVPDFSLYTNVVEKKKAFFAYLLPEIRRQNFIVLKERKMVLALYELISSDEPLSTNQQAVFTHLLKKYQLLKKKDMSREYLLSQLIQRVDEIPAALILVQAANESGWGTSRFARLGYNFFGLWCFRKGCGFVPNRREEGTDHEVAKFKDLSHAVMTYVRNLNRLYAYHELREIRMELRRQGKTVTATALAKGLSKYSERGQEYIDEIQSMIRVNKKHMGLTQ